MTLSIVMAARNDNYGGDFLFRLQCSVDSIAHGVDAAELPAELIIVEWNPPDDRPPLKTALRLPGNTKFLSVRIITVPKEQHERFGVKIPLIEYTAKNVGIRRAKGDFILVTNPDIFFPKALFKMFAAEEPDETAFYRADRIDITPPEKEFEALSHSEKETYCSANVIQANILSGTFPVTKGKTVPATFDAGEIVFVPLVSAKDIYTNAAGDFLLASNGAWNAIGGFKETTEYFTALDAVCCLQMLSLGLRQRVFPSLCPIWHFDHSRDTERLYGGPAYKDYFSYQDKLFDKISLIPINDEAWGLAGVELPCQTLLASSEYHPSEANCRTLLYRQTLDLLRRVKKNPPFESPRKSGTLFLYDCMYPETNTLQQQHTPCVVDSSQCLKDGFSQKNTPDLTVKSWLPHDKQSHFFTPFFPAPDCTGGVQTLTITLRFSSGSTDLARDYLCRVQDAACSTLGEFTCSPEPEQVCKVRLAYLPEQLIRFTLSPSGIKEYVLPESICIDTDSYSPVVDFYRDRENLRDAYNAQISSRWWKLGKKLGIVKTIESRRNYETF